MSTNRSLRPKLQDEHIASRKDWGAYLEGFADISSVPMQKERIDGPILLEMARQVRVQAATARRAAHQQRGQTREIAALAGETLYRSLVASSAVSAVAESGQ